MQSKQVKPWHLLKPEPPDMMALVTQVIHELMTLSEQIDTAYGFRSKVGFKAGHALAAAEDLRRYLRNVPKHGGPDDAATTAADPTPETPAGDGSSAGQVHHRRPLEGLQP